MNAGNNRQHALQQALANAKLDGKPRYVHYYGMYYWIESRSPSPGSMAGLYGSDYNVVYPDGHYEPYDPTKGVSRELADWAADQGGGPPGPDHH